MDCGVGPVSAKGHQCVTGEIVGISPTFDCGGRVLLGLVPHLIVGGELNQHKNRGSLSPLGLVFEV